MDFGAHDWEQRPYNNILVEKYVQFINNFLYLCEPPKKTIWKCGSYIFLLLLLIAMFLNKSTLAFWKPQFIVT